MSAFVSHAPLQLREMLLSWARNYGRSKPLSELEINDWYIRLGDLDADACRDLALRVEADPTVLKFPTWAQVAVHAGGRGGSKGDTRVDMNRALVWGVDGSWQGNIEAVPWSEREKIALYVKGNLYQTVVGGVFVPAMEKLRQQQLNFIGAIHPPTAEAIFAEAVR